MLRPTFAEISLKALCHNFGAIQKRLPQNARMLAMVKADGYGHGAPQVAQKLIECGVTGLGVATIEEGIELRDANISAPILIMGGMLGMGEAACETMLEHALTPVIHSLDAVVMLESVAARRRKKTTVHLKVDTGMSRLGVRPEALRAVLAELSRCEWLSVQGVMTHLASVHDAESTSQQVEQFLSIKTHIENALGPVSIWHIGNGGAILEGRPLQLSEDREWWVRPGLLLYGTKDGCVTECEVQPVMVLKSHIALLKTIPENTKVSYGGTFTAKRLTRLGVVPIGYADGYPWRVSGKASVLVGGQKIPVIGRVTMDMIMIDVTDLAQVNVGDEVVLMGTQGTERITVDDVAKWAGTLPYEIFCGISKRMPRVYVE
ncbi:MAG: alanine racemase [Deltaproteobacteria bacterium]|nr:alanine racemase [Deltaproteobacteria bacterium]